MTVCRPFVTLLALFALFFSAGCGGDGGTVTPDETTDPMYQRAQDLKKQGRYAEALSSYLKVIDHRGEGGAPESHLEAGALYLNWSHDPVEAWHHFSKYLELQPTGPRSEIVRGQRDAAKRELAKTLLAPSNDQVMRVATEDVEQLRRRVQELEAENQMLRGVSSATPMRAPPVIALPDDSASPAPAEVPTDPARTPSGESPFIRSLASGTNAAAPAMRPTPVIPAPAPSYAGDRAAAAPTRPAATQHPAVEPRGAPAVAGRTHTVKSSEKSLWGIARQYYGGSVNSARVQTIYAANRDVMRSPNDLRPGMVLRIP